MNIVFMGTPDIAATALAALLQDGNKVVGVFTREDKPVGRKQVMTAPPVKILALENGIPVFQPKTLKNEEVYGQIAGLEPDLIVVVAYGRLLPKAVLELPRFGCINMHVSLLPSYRGAAPIQWAVINGEKETGVTIMQLDEGLDTGPALAMQTVEIGPEATAGEVFELVSTIGSRLLCETVTKVLAGEVTAQPQQGEATLAPPLSKQMAEVDFLQPALQLHNLVRGCNPWPLAWFTHQGKKIKVLRAKPTDAVGKAGSIISVTPLTVACGQDALVLEHVVPEGARPMTGAQWAAGRRFKIGDSILE